MGQEFENKQETLVHQSHNMCDFMSFYTLTMVIDCLMGVVGITVFVTRWKLGYEDNFPEKQCMICLIYIALVASERELWKWRNNQFEQLIGFGTVISHFVSRILLVGASISGVIVTLHFLIPDDSKAIQGYQIM